MISQSERRRAAEEALDVVPHTCGPVSEALEIARDALKDAERESENGRVKLRDALVEAIAERNQERERAEEAERDLRSARETISDLRERIRELEASA